MTGHANFNSRVRTTMRSGSRILIVALTLAGVFAAAESVNAASVSLTWTAPTTNANGTPLTDLANYHVYLGTAAPSCPGASFLTVSSPTSTPPSGQTVGSRVTGLTAGATYFARITAVDSTGNESVCSPTASGVAQADFSVTPTTTTDFGSVTTGAIVDRNFTVQNTSTVSISGTASVGSPYSIVGGGSFALAAGASQVVTVRFQPTGAGTFAGNVNFTAGGDTISRGVTGLATSTAMVALSVTKSGTGAGTVTSAPAGLSCGATCTLSVPMGTPMTLTASATSGSTFVRWGGACSGSAASCAWTMNVNTTVSAIFDTNQVAVPLDVPVVSSLAPASAPAGSGAITLTVNGSRFSASSVVRWNGATRTTTVVSATQLRAALTASDLVTVGSIPVSVFTPAPGGGTSATVSFPITATAAVPVVPAAPSQLSVTLLGTDAIGATFSVAWSAVSGATSYRYVAAFSDGTAAQQGTVTGLVSLQLRMPYDVSGAARSGFVCIRSVGATGLQSVDQSCTGLSVPARPSAPVVPVVPVASSLSPASAVAGSAGFTLTVNGSGFVASSVVRWNGTPRTTTFVSATQLRTAIAASDLLTSGSVPVSVFTPAPGGGVSGIVGFAITAPTVPPVPSTAPAAPGNPSVTLLGVNGGGATFAITWGAVSGATSYSYVAAFFDGSAAQQGTVTGPSFQLRMPYHVTGAAVGGFVCLRSVNAAGQQSTDQSCNALLVPAR
jgi:Divergent InlB B-repeat domain